MGYEIRKVCSEYQNTQLMCNSFFGNRVIYKIIARHDGRAREAKNI